MTDLRTAAQQALEALQDFKRRGHWGDFDNLTGTLQAALGCDHCNQPLYAAVKCRVCGRETPIIEPEIKGNNKPDVADDLAFIVRNAIAYIKELELERQMALNALVMMRDKYGEYACPACDHADAAIAALKGTK